VTCSFYLAAASTQVGRVSMIAKRLEDSGLATVPFKWWLRESDLGHDDVLTLEQKREVASRCFYEIDNAEVFWWLADTRPSSAPIEFGYALRRSLDRHCCRVIASGSAINARALVSLATFTDPSDDVALVECLRIAEEYR